MKSKENKKDQINNDQKNVTAKEDSKETPTNNVEVVGEKMINPKNTEEIFSDGYHNPQDVEVIQKLSLALDTASENIRNMQSYEEESKRVLLEKENLINSASQKIEEQEKLIKELENKNKEILATKASSAMQEEISKAIEFGNKIKAEAKETAEKEKENIISEATLEAENILSEAKKEAKLEMVRRDEANKAYHEVIKNIELYYKTFGELLANKK